MSEPLWCEVRGHYCRCHDFGRRCDDFDDLTMEGDVQQAQASRRVVTERLLRLQSDPAMVHAVGAAVRLENPLGVFGGHTVEAPRKALRGRWVSRVGSELLPDVAEQLATGAQGNGLQHHCACSARSPSTNMPRQPQLDPITKEK